MAISLLQDAQTRSLAAALAGMQPHEDLERPLSLSPTMSANNSSAFVAAMYPSLQHAAAASAFSMLSPSQLLTANRQAAAAFMAAQLPISTLATTLFPPNHPAALFAPWARATATAPNNNSNNSIVPPSTTATAANAANLSLSAATQSPPTSPLSPINVQTPAATAKHSLEKSSPISSFNAEDNPPKKTRKLSMKSKDLNSPTNVELPLNVGDLYSSTTPMSPPSSGSSPNSSTLEAISPLNANSKDTTSLTRDKSFTCKICSRSFGYKHVLQNHERTHTGEKPFECPECHKRFTRDHHLKTHMRLHTGEKPYHCSHCDRQFVQVANLRRHLRVHTGERPYICDICDGKFSDSNQLKSHMLVHNGEKPYECERCYGKFRRRHHLLNHKCGGIQSPITPTLSPTISVDSNTTSAIAFDQKSVESEESLIEVGGKPPASAPAPATEPATVQAPAPTMPPTATTTSTLQSTLLATYTTSSDGNSSEVKVNVNVVDEDVPLDLSEDGSNSINNEELNNDLRYRKVNDIRRVFRLPPPQICHFASDMPEQTEPEDLSMHSPRHQQRRSNHESNSSATSCTASSLPSSAAQSPDSQLVKLGTDDSDDITDNGVDLSNERHSNRPLRCQRENSKQQTQPPSRKRFE